MDCPRASAFVVFVCQSPFRPGKRLGAWDSRHKGEEQYPTDTTKQEAYADGRGDDKCQIRFGNGNRYEYDKQRRLSPRHLGFLASWDLQS